DKGMEGEDRRGRKSRQYDDRLAIHGGEAERLARLECDAMDENIPELRDDAMRQIARALRRAAGEHDQMARCEPAANRTCQGRLIVRERAEGHRFPTAQTHRHWRDRTAGHRSARGCPGPAHGRGPPPERPSHSAAATDRAAL